GARAERSREATRLVGRSRKGRAHLLREPAHAHATQQTLVTWILPQRREVGEVGHVDEAQLALLERVVEIAEGGVEIPELGVPARTIRRQETRDRRVEL